MNETLKSYWEGFLTETNLDKNTKCFEAFYFGYNEHTATELLKLVLEGTKTATTSCVYQYDLTNSPYPQVGNFSIVTDYFGNPKCIIETKNVLKIKFNEVTYDICKREGEDDTLESWQENHIKFFTEVGKDLGFEFAFDMYVLFEDFEVVYKWGKNLL